MSSCLLLCWDVTLHTNHNFQMWVCGRSSVFSLPGNRCWDFSTSTTSRQEGNGHMEWKPTDVTILFVYCWISTCQQSIVTKTGHNIQSTRTDRHRHWTNGCVNSCMNSPEDGPVGPKHVEIQQYTNKIVTSLGFHSICWKDAWYKKLKKHIKIHSPRALYWMNCRAGHNPLPATFEFDFSSQEMKLNYYRNAESKNIKKKSLCAHHEGVCGNWKYGSTPF